MCTVLLQTTWLSEDAFVADENLTCFKLHLTSTFELFELLISKSGTPESCAYISALKACVVSTTQWRSRNKELGGQSLVIEVLNQ